MNAREMRTVYCETLIELASNDDRICVLDADLLGANGLGRFQETFPRRTFNIGVAEANMVGIASGLSVANKIPFASSFASFITRKTLDQFYISANYSCQNVKLTGTDPGIEATYNGGTHMTFDDIGVLRGIPGIVLLEPSDCVSLRSLLPRLAEFRGCSYMRLSRKSAQVLYKDSESFQIGKAKLLEDGDDVTLISCGALMVKESLSASQTLRSEGIKARVIDMHTIKPIDRELILESARKTGRIVTCENHNVYNGLGSAVAEVIAQECPVYLERVGINELFGEVGTLEYLKDRFELTCEHIVKRVKNLLRRKNGGLNSLV
jgi:transketolase